MKKNKRFVTIFPYCTNNCLTKDVGMIAYNMHIMYGFDSYIVTYPLDPNYRYINQEVSGLKIAYLKNNGNILFDGLQYLLLNSKKIDILQLFHITSTYNLIWIALYKLINPNGKVYLKLDGGLEFIKIFAKMNKLKKMIVILILKKCTLISTEVTETARVLTKILKVNIKCIPNGVYDLFTEEPVTYSEKDNIICTVGRIGTYQKATEILLEAYIYFWEKNKNWKLIIIGEIEKSFINIIDIFYKNNPEVAENVIFTGHIEDKEKLKDYYRRSKIFCMTSRYESFGLVYLEAMSQGCYIVSTEVESLKDIIDSGKYGKSVAVNDSKAFAATLLQITENETVMQENCLSVQNYVKSKFCWKEICREVYEWMEIQINN